MSRIYVTILIICSAILSACKKLVTVPPPSTSIVSATTFASDASSTAAVSGIYSRMIGGNGYAGVGVTTGNFASGNQGSVTFYASLYADELVNYPSSGTSSSFYFYGNRIPSTQTEALWGEIYQYIDTSNAAIEGLADSTTAVSPAVRKQLTGECHFIRAFCYFYLANLFGDVPLIITTDYLRNQSASRTDTAKVYDQIVADLEIAKEMLPADYAAIEGQERIRPIKWAAAALLARTYLYRQQWAKAEAEASAVIGSGQYDLTPDLQQVFLKNSSETIWSLRPVIPNQNTPDALTFLLTDVPSTALNNVTLLSKLLFSFEPGDQRRLQWIDSITIDNQTYYFAYKYRVAASPDEPLIEYSMVLRLAEQFLIRAEARARQNNLPGAQNDLNEVRHRARLGNIVATDQPELLTGILHERQTELFTEWGHRWLDLKRTGSADSVMTVACPLKGTEWQPDARLWPIPLSELQANRNLTQNPGYN